MHSLIEAVLKNNFEKVADCLKQGANPNGYEDWAKVRPLHLAVLNNALESAKVLVAAGC